MIVRTTAAALTLSLSLIAAAAASPDRPRAWTHPGHAAQAQAIDSADESISRRRAEALRTCNELASKYSQPTYGNMQSYEYRSCMAERGMRE